MLKDGLEITLVFAVALAMSLPLGHYLAKVFQGEKTLVGLVVGPIERLVFRLAGVSVKEEQHWTRYAFALIGFNLVGFVVLFVILKIQYLLPYNPQNLPGVTADLAFNIAASFVTNSNWQSYNPEASLSPIVQMIGLTVQNFLSAATGLALGVAIARGFAGRGGKSIGNFYVDLTRAIFYVLLPGAILVALVLMFLGVPQTFSSPVDVTTLEGTTQTILLGPVASQVAIKILGTNGGGFFAANSAHPFENPSALANAFGLIVIMILPAALIHMFGVMVKDKRQSWALFSTLLILFFLSVGSLYLSEKIEVPALAKIETLEQPVSNLEGKEWRLGIAGSAAWAAAATTTSNGSLNASLEGFHPLASMVSLINMMLGEVVFGGIGTGLNGLILYVVVAVFMAGLMVGRTPEYLGKKIEAREMKLAMLAVVWVPCGFLVLTALATILPGAQVAMTNEGPRAFSRMLHAYASATTNNGSALAGFPASEPVHNLLTGIAMLFGRFAFVVPMLAIAGSLCAKKRLPVTMATIPTHKPLFVVLLLMTILIIGVPSFFPALALGPVVEYLQMAAGKVY